MGQVCDVCGVCVFVWCVCVSTCTVAEKSVALAILICVMLQA